MRTVKKITVLVFVVAAGAWAYRSNVASGRTTMDMNMRVTSGSTPFPVTLAPVERGPVSGSVVYTGTVAAFTEEDVYPRVTGRIVEMPVYPGDAIRPGQVLARLDDLELSSRVREAEAMLTTVEANRTQMEADLIAARHGVVQMEKELAMTEAEAGYQQSVAARDEQLFGKGAIAQQEAENSQAMAAASRARVEAARAKLEQARAMEASAVKKLEAASAMVAQSGAAARTARVVRDYVTITASSAGYVVKRLVAPGVLVQPGMAILKVAQIDKVRLQANVGEKDLPLIRVGIPVTVTTTGNGHPPFRARVTSVFPFVDQGARTAVVEAVVENNGRKLLTGQYVTMQFVAGERLEALSVSRGAVVRTAGKATVWVVEGDRAEPREVVTGLENPDRVEITKGLTGGERVIASGHEGLYAGARVSAVAKLQSARPAVSPPLTGAPGRSDQAGAAIPGSPGRPEPETPAETKETSHGAH